MHRIVMIRIAGGKRATKRFLAVLPGVGLLLKTCLSDSPFVDHGHTLFAAGYVPFLETLSCSSSDNIILDTGPKVLPDLFVDAHKRVTRETPYGCRSVISQSV